MRIGFLFAAAVAAAICALATPAMAWSPININDPEYQDMARWAVTEHVKKANDGIKFKKLLSGEVGQTLIGLGILCHLIIEASNGNGKDGKYRAVVEQKDWGFKSSSTLVSFRPVAELHAKVMRG